MTEETSSSVVPASVVGEAKTGFDWNMLRWNLSAFSRILTQAVQQSSTNEQVRFLAPNINELSNSVAEFASAQTGGYKPSLRNSRVRTAHWQQGMTEWQEGFTPAREPIDHFMNFRNAPAWMEQLAKLFAEDEHLRSVVTAEIAGFSKSPAIMWVPTYRQMENADGAAKLAEGLVGTFQALLASLERGGDKDGAVIAQTAGHDTIITIE